MDKESHETLKKHPRRDVQHHSGADVQPSLKVLAPSGLSGSPKPFGRDSYCDEVRVQVDVMLLTYTRNRI